MKNELVKEELEKLKQNKEEIEEDNLKEESSVIEENVILQQEELEDKDSISYIAKTGCEENIVSVNKLIEDIILLIT